MNRLAALRSRMPAWLLPVLALLAAVVGALAVAGAGPGFQVGVVGLSGAFSLIRFGVVLASIGAVVGLVALLTSFLRGGAPGTLVAVLALAVAVPAVWLPWNLRQQAAEVPPIHDITTDTGDPPAFVAAAAQRGPGHNDPAYGGERVARLQRRAYPDIRPIELDVSPEHAMDAAIMVVREFGWEVLDLDRDSGRVEATAETFWFGFQDDVVVRVRERDGGSRVDVRSASRLGVSDLGVNAERVREFSERLPDAVERVAEPYGEPSAGEEAMQTGNAGLGGFVPSGLPVGPPSASSWSGDRPDGARPSLHGVVRLRAERRG